MRKRYSAAFKAQIVQEVLREEKSVAQCSPWAYACLNKPPKIHIEYTTTP